MSLMGFSRHLLTAILVGMLSSNPLLAQAPLAASVPPQALLGNATGQTFYANAYNGAVSGVPCIWDAAHDVGDCVNAARAAAYNGGSVLGIVQIPAGIFGISTTFTQTGTKAGVIVQGAGGPLQYGVNKTVLKWIGASGGTVVNYNPGSTAQTLVGCGLSHLTVDGNSLAATGVLARAFNNCWFVDVGVQGVTANAWDLDAGDWTNGGWSQNWFIADNIGLTVAASASANGWKIGQGATTTFNNGSDNHWIGGLVQYQGGTGFSCGAATGNDVSGVDIQPVGGGTGVSLDMLGSASNTALACAGNRFITSGGFGRSNATAPVAESNTNPSVRNYIYQNTGNGAGLPVVNGSGSTLASLTYDTDTGAHFTNVPGVSSSQYLPIPLKCDGFRAYDGAMTSGGSTLTSASAAFNASVDVGKAVTVNGAGPTRFFGTATIAAAGNTYAVGDTVTLAGGTSTQAAQVVVRSISGGGATGPVTAVAGVPYNQGSYSVVPGNPVSQSSTSGSGTGLTLNVTWLRDNLVTTVSSVTDPTHVVLATSASATVSGALWGYGTDYAAQINAQIATGRDTLPGGICGVGSTVNVGQYQSLIGQGFSGYSNGPTALMWLGPVGGTVLNLNNGSLMNSAQVRGLDLFGMGADSIGIKMRGLQWATIEVHTFDDKDAGASSNYSDDHNYDSFNDRFYQLASAENQPWSVNAACFIAEPTVASATHNFNQNTFTDYYCLHQNGNGLDLQSAYANTWDGQTQIFNGTGNGYSLFFYGSNDTTKQAHGNTFGYVQAQRPLFSQGGTSPANANKITALDYTAYAPAVTIQAGGTLYCTVMNSTATWNGVCSAQGALATGTTSVSLGSGGAEYINIPQSATGSAQVNAIGNPSNIGMTFGLVVGGATQNALALLSPSLALQPQGYIDAGVEGSTITSAPPAAGTNIGWKLGFYGSSYAMGIAGSTWAVLTNPWFSVFSSAPAGNGSISAPDTNAGVSLGTDGSIVPKAKTVSALPNCVPAITGAKYYVTDQNTAVSYLGAVTGSGSTKQWVYCNGSAYVQGG